MSRIFSLIVLAIFTLSLFCSTTAQARAPKKYQVTGTVLEVTADYITVDKAGEKWEIGRDANTKITGTPKVGGKVTIEYTMSASKVDVKSEK